MAAPQMHESPNHVTRLVDQIPELVARLTGHAVGCECDRCRVVLARLLAAAQRDIDAGRRADGN